MRLATWNVNSIRRRLALVLDFIEVEQPDVLCMQETKCTNAQFPASPFTDLGYEVAVHGQGGHGGVAMASRIGLERITKGFGGTHGPPFDEPRLLAADVGDTRLMTLYAPNGQRIRTPAWEAKLAWFELLRIELDLELTESPRLVVAGDFNVCPAEIDVYNPAKRHRNLVSDPERAAIARILDDGFVDVARDLHSDEPGYSWYAFSAGQFAAGRGYRLDLVLASPEVAGEFTSCRPLRKWREPELSPSDHTPVIAEL